MRAEFRESRKEPVELEVAPAPQVPVSGGDFFPIAIPGLIQGMVRPPPGNSRTSSSISGSRGAATPIGLSALQRMRKAPTAQPPGGSKRKDPPGLSDPVPAPASTQATQLPPSLVETRPPAPMEHQQPPPSEPSAVGQSAAPENAPAPTYEGVPVPRAQITGGKFGPFVYKTKEKGRDVTYKLDREVPDGLETVFLKLSSANKSATLVGPSAEAAETLKKTKADKGEADRLAQEAANNAVMQRRENFTCTFDEGAYKHLKNSKYVRGMTRKELEDYVLSVIRGTPGETGRPSKISIVRTQGPSTTCTVQIGLGESIMFSYVKDEPTKAFVFHVGQGNG